MAFINTVRPETAEGETKKNYDMMNDPRKAPLEDKERAILDFVWIWSADIMKP
jgi:hypothetical protein